MFVDWQSCSEHGGELIDPARGQYKEFFIVCNGLLDGEEVTTCPYIWVDRDFALARGWIQGFPKKLGSIWITRTFGLDCPADPGLRSGATFGGTSPPTSAASPRPASRSSAPATRGRPTTTRRSTTCVISPHLAAGSQTSPRCTSSSARSAVDRAASDVWEGSATLELFGAPSEEHDRARAGAGRQGLSAHASPTRSTTSRRWRSCEHDPADVAEVAGVEVSTDHFIGGERVAGGERFDDISADRRAGARRGLARQRREAERRSRAPPPRRSRRGRRSGLDGRAEHLHRLADLIDANVDRIAAIECEDMAMLLESLRARVIGRAARATTAPTPISPPPTRSATGARTGPANRVQRMPSGPAVVITPWNAPFMLSTWKTAPALAAGCTVVLKPAEWSPLSCSLLADLALEAGLPPGVFNVVQGIGEEVGAALVANPRRAPDLVHRLAADGARDRRRRGGQRRPVHRRARGQGPARRLRRRRPRRGGGRRRRDSTTIRARSASRAPGSSSRRRSPRNSSSASSAAADAHVLGDPREREDDDLADDPPRAPRAGRGLRRAGARERRPRSSAAAASVPRPAGCGTSRP